jgi:hypothetical protein
LHPSLDAVFNREVGCNLPLLPNRLRNNGIGIACQFVV